MNTNAIMGGVSSVSTDSSAAFFLHNSARFFIKSITVSVPNTLPHNRASVASKPLESSNNTDRHIVGSPGSHLVLPNHTGAFSTIIDAQSLTLNTSSLDSLRLVEYVQVCYTVYLSNIFSFFMKLTK